MNSAATRPLIIAIIVGAFIIAIGLAIGLGIGLRDRDDNENEIKGETNGAEELQGLSGTGSYSYAAVVADSKVCSDIGNDVLARMGGNAIDATVAALFCSGVVSAHSAGIGGGSFYTIYIKSTDSYYSADSRETAPRAATEDMFSGDTERKSLLGGLAVGVPGEVRGLYEVHQRFGRVPWKSLVLPTKKLCEQGVPLTAATHTAVARSLSQVPSQYKDKFSAYYDENNNPKPVGSSIKLPELAATFDKIADTPLSFYEGPLAQDIVDDLTEHGAIITLDDLRNYTVKWSSPTNITLPGGYTVFSTPPPGSGLVLNFILSILSGYNMSPASIADDASKILTYHRAIEAMKFAYGKRSELGDENFIDMEQYIRNMSTLSFGDYFRAQIDDSRTFGTDHYNPSFSVREDHGTTHLSVLDGEGNAVSVTSTINTYFGSKVKGTKTGIVFNNEMDDFSTFNSTNYFGLPASPANYIQPGKRPMSSMSPAVVTDANGNVRMVTGAAGGSKITTATAMNIMNVLWFGQSLQEAIDEPRFHHQLKPEALQVEEKFPQALINGLKAKGHEIINMQGISVIQAIEVQNDGNIVGTADYRKGGQPAGF